MKKQILIAVITLLIVGQTQPSLGQTTINMEKEGGVYIVPCTVNGLKLKFIFDTGASDVSISLTEAIFMLKNGYLKESEIIGTSYAQIANGDITENTKIILREIEFAGLKIYNVKASVVHELAAPLLLGQTAMSKLGKFELDPNTGVLTILNAPSNNAVNNSINTTYVANTSLNNTSIKSFVTTQYKTKLMRTPKDILETEPNEIYVPYGMQLKVIGVENGYYKVEYNNVIGYLNSFVAK